MKTNVRIGTFETNSSSTHSLVCVTSAAAKEYVEYVKGKEGLKAYEELFPGDDDRYTRKEVLDSLEEIGATLKDGVLDLTTIDSEHYDFGYTEAYRVSPAYKFLLVVALRDALAGKYYYYDDDNDHDIMKKLRDEFDLKKIIVPEDLYESDHQSRDDLLSQIQWTGAIEIIRRKNIVLVLDHD